MQDEDEVRLPLRLGRYELVARIAAGGMAEVFAAADATAKRIVAIKLMRRELLAEERFVAMFVDEARVAAHIAHPNVVGMHDLGRDERGVPYLVMDLVLGASLSQLLKGDAGLDPKAMPLPLALEVAAQAAEGLHAAHEARDALGTPLEIVHRDVSPQNILLGVDGRVRITDFGVARAVARLTRTESGEVKGKARYFSPEQATGRSVDRRSDLFALGVVLWEVLALKPLFTGRTMAEVLTAVATQPVPDIRAQRPDVPESVVRVMAHAMERTLERRIGSGAELAAALREAARLGGVAPASAREISAYVRARGGQMIGTLAAEIRAHTRIPLDDAAPAPPATDFDEDEPTTVDQALVARVQRSRVPSEPPAEEPTLDSASLPGATVPETMPSPALAQVIASAAAAAAVPVSDASPRPGASTLPLGAMVPPDVAALVPAAVAAPKPPGGASQAESPCPRCGRVVLTSSLAYTSDGAQVCRACAAADVVAEGDRSAVTTLAGMGYGALLAGLLTLCMTWIPWVNLVPAILAIGGAVAFFVNVSRSPEHRRAMGWQLPAATIAASIGLALGLLVPITYLLILAGLAAAG